MGGKMKNILSDKETIEVKLCLLKLMDKSKLGNLCSENCVHWNKEIRSCGFCK